VGFHVAKQGLAHVLGAVVERDDPQDQRLLEFDAQR
jgi:hypothetical protein